MNTWTLHHVDFHGQPVSSFTYTRKPAARSAYRHAAARFDRGDLLPAVIEVCLYDPNDELVASTMAGQDLAGGRDAQGDWPNRGEMQRLAERARFHGMTLRTERHGDRLDHVIDDPRDDSSHYVTLVSCDCFLFAAAQGCQHHALFTDLNAHAANVTRVVLRDSDGPFCGLGAMIGLDAHAERGPSCSACLTA